MEKETKEYLKLPGTKKGFLIGKYTLWQGADHLLHIFSRMGSEDYKRFYFGDIQAIIARKTASGKVQNIILGCFIFLFMLPAAAFRGEGSIFFGITAGSLLLVLLVNWMKGPTCETRIMTAVQTERLHTVHRLKDAFKLMNRLRPHIEQAQGPLVSEDLTQTAVRRPVNGATADAAGHSEWRKKTSKHEKGGAHMILFTLLLFEGVVASCGFFFSHVALTVLGSAASLATGVFLILALVKQHDSDMNPSLRAITWTTLGFVCISLIAGYTITAFFALKYPGLIYNQWEFFKVISAVSPWENSLFLSLDVFTLCGSLFLGIPGLIMLKRHENKDKNAAGTAIVAPRQAAEASDCQPG